MSGQSAAMSRDEVRSAIKSVESNKGSEGKGGSKMSLESMKTTNKKNSGTQIKIQNALKEKSHR